MSDDASSQRYTGQVKWFNNKAGYGFITVTQPGDFVNKDIFTHFSSIDVTNEAKTIDKPIPLSELSEGKGKIIGYTVLPETKVEDKKAVIYIEDINGDRKVLISYDKNVLINMGENEWVGKSVNFKDNFLV